MATNFEFEIKEIENNELKIRGRKTTHMGVALWKQIVINKSWIPWMITTLRNTSMKEYDTEHSEKSDFGDCTLCIFFEVRDNDYSYIEIWPYWADKEKRTPGIEIPYLSYVKSKCMSEFIEPFLQALEKYVPEEERNKLPKSWEIEPEKKKNEIKESDEGTISLKFVQEIDPRDYFG